MATRLSRIAARLTPRLVRVGSRLSPLARLARLDARLARAWLRNVGPIADEVGAAEADAYTNLVIEAAERDPEVAALVAHTLPDHLARVEAGERGRYASLLGAVLRDRVEALSLVLRTVPDLLGRMDDESLARYLAQALVIHAESAVRAESFLKMESGESHREASRLRKGLALQDVRRTLALYARAHCGETVHVVAGPQGPGQEGAFTDGRNIYLPAEVERFGDERDFLVYRVLTARNAGHLEFGTLDLELDRIPGTWPERREGELELERLFRSFPNRVLARDLFAVLENARIESRVRAEYPGVARDMDRLAHEWRPDRPDPATLAPAEQAVEWMARVAAGMAPPRLPDPGAQEAARQGEALLLAVRGPEATVDDVVRALQAIYQPVDALLLRVDESTLKRLDAPGDAEGGPARARRGGPRGAGSDDPRLGGRSEEGADYRPLAADPLGAELRVDALGQEDRQVEARALELLESMRAGGADATLAEARKQARREGASYQEMADFLDRMQAPAGPARELRPDANADQVPVGTTGGDRTPISAGAEAITGVFVYPEWDARIDDHKPRWVKLTEYRLKPASHEFVDRVREEYGPLIGQVRRAFEALRPRSVRRVRGLPDGDTIDIDRAVEARIERRAGGSPSDRIYLKHLKDDRDVAVAFLVDMSSSTNEVVNADAKRVIDVEKEALVLIAEAVQAIGDAFAVYGFSGYGRDQVAFYVAKDFEDPYSDEVRERIGRISWKMENRDGAAIRHATTKLVGRAAKVKLLLLLSDGKPLDCGCDHYADRYAQEDTRVALSEARRAGIHPFCITVDPQGQQYLSRMYGEGSYTVIDRVERLPVRLPLIYRRLTR